MQEQPSQASKDEDRSEDQAAKPRKKRRRILVAIIVLLILIMAFPVANLVLSRPKTGVLATHISSDEWTQKAAVVLERNCMDCHSTFVAMPFYARWPIARQMIGEHIEEGVRVFDMPDVLRATETAPVMETALAQVEYVLDQNSMPPLNYGMMHWDRFLSKEEKATLRTWIREVRKAHFCVPLASEEFKYAVVQPLPDSVPVDERKVALGKLLYHDTRLSGDGTLSCASCHGLDTGGVDRKPTSIGIGGAVGPINAPTVYNAVFNFKQFWDGRAADLQEQAAGPVTNPIEMGAQWTDVIAELKKDVAFVAAFTAVYPEGLSTETVTHAIAEFEKTLITPDSPFDLFLKGDKNALNTEEKEGFALFLDAGCAVCHVGKAMGGQSFEKLGRYRPYFTDQTEITEADLGRFNVTKAPKDKHRFKVPTLRNIAVTPPYFHNALTTDLKEAVLIMTRHQSEEPLSDDQAAKVAAFLKTLTGKYDGEVLQ